MPPESATPAAAPEPRSYIAGILTAGIASVCGAIFTSWLGTQGTLAGAMLGATIGSSVSEIVRAPLTSLERRLIQAGVSARRLRRDGVMKTVLSSPTAAQQALGMISRRAVVTVAVVALVGFGLAMGGVTAVEVASGEPLAAMVSDEAATGTTVGRVLPNPPPVLAPATLTPTVVATAQAAVNSGGPGADASLPAARGNGGQPGVAASPSPADNDNSSPVVDATGSPVTAVGSPDASATATGTVSGTPDSTPGTATPATVTPAASTQASQTATVATAASDASEEGTLTPTRAATSATTSASTPGTTSTAAAGSPTTAPTSGAQPAGTATLTITPTSTRTPVGGATPTPSPTSTPTPTSAPGASTPAAPPGTAPPPPQT